MKEYISREVANNALRECVRAYPNSFYNGIEVSRTAIRKLPAADVREVVRGKWIDHQQGRWVYAKCSECETVHDVRSNFCPNCGADMRGEADGN